MRDPSIHITKSDFEGILKYLEVDNFPVQAFFTIANKKAVSSRILVISNKKDTNKVNNILLASKGDAQLVADLIYATRIKLKHRGIRKITEANKRDWVLCKKLAELCNSYCQDFNLETREGFIEYIQTGIGRMNGRMNNFLNRLVSMYENIVQETEVKIEIRENIGFKEDALKICDYFIKKVASSTGIYDNYKDNPEKMVHFYRLAKFIKDRNWAYGLYIDAQFEALAFCNGIPHIENLYSDKAVENFSKHIFKKDGANTNSIIIEDVVEGSLWDTINK